MDEKEKDKKMPGLKETCTGEFLDPKGKERSVFSTPHSSEGSLNASVAALEKMFEESGVGEGSGGGGAVEEKESEGVVSWGVWWALAAIVLSVVGVGCIGDYLLGTPGALAGIGVWSYVTWRAN